MTLVRQQIGLSEILLVLNSFLQGMHKPRVQKVDEVIYSNKFDQRTMIRAKFMFTQRTQSNVTM